MFVSETEFVVRYAETDRMGIVHHSNYPIWFEMGRTEYIKEAGISYSEIEARGSMLPLFIPPARYSMHS
jgi:acyl-CoA thioester hydrolase